MLKEKQESYRIVRYFQDMRRPEIIYRGFTLEEAITHCSNPHTKGTLPHSGIEWFDGYTKDVK